MVLHSWFTARLHDVSPSDFYAASGLARPNLGFCHVIDRQWLSLLPKLSEACLVHQKVINLLLHRSVYWAQIHPQLPPFLADYGNLRNYDVRDWSTSTVSHSLPKLLGNLCV